MKKTAIVWWMALLTAGLSSCEKGEYTKSYHTFVDVYFDATATKLTSDEGPTVALRYNGNQVDWDFSPGRVRVVEGEGTFEFYDKRSNKVLCDTTIDVLPGEKQRYSLFQPTIGAAVTFIDPDGQASEEAAPEGHIKLRIANYAQDLIPFAQTDIKVFVKYSDEEWNEYFAEVGTIRNVSTKIEKAAFVTLPTGVPEDGLDAQYYFEFMDSATGQTILDHGGSTYRTSAFYPTYPDPENIKNVFTIYLAPLKAWGEAPPFIKKGEDFYEIAINVLYAD
ncbi:hypothetical protein ACS126_06050 [Sphingobacterium lactis]|uniref:hypothetical protein n=1 Tax=Sphingobacterium lactis TaxID=797291 RepID=UPI003EC72BCD